MAKILDGVQLANLTKQQIKLELTSIISKGIRKPKLVVMLVGNNKASEIYVKNKCKSCKEVGIISEVTNFAKDTKEQELIQYIAKLNQDNDVDGILIQLPLPPHLNTEKIVNHINPAKDVDCFTYYNFGFMVKTFSGIMPCTPKGILKIIHHYKINLASKHVVVIGKSNLVGKPISNLMLNLGATVTICHSKTANLNYHTKNADLIVCAVGKPGLLQANMLKSNAIVIDVGINHQDGKLVGDANFNDLKEKVYAITPVPGGIGPMTVASLIENTFYCYKKNLKLDAN